MFCTENNDPTSTEQTGASCICPEADLSVDQWRRKQAAKHIILPSLFFCFAKAAWCGWSRVGGPSEGVSSDKLCLRVIALLVISRHSATVIVVHAKYY